MSEYNVLNTFLSNAKAQNKSVRKEYPSNFRVAQTEGLQGDVKAREAAIDFLAQAGEQARTAGFASNPDLAQALARLNAEGEVTGPSLISQTLQMQALAELGRGGELSPGQVRTVTQGTRAAFSARGLADSNPALISEVLSLENARQQRERERQGFAAQVDAQAFAEQQGNRDFLQNVVAADQAYDPAMTVLGINSQPAMAAGLALTEGASQGALQLSSLAHDMWSTEYNAEAAAEIAYQNRKAGLKSAEMSAAASRAAGKSSMMGAGIGAAGTIVGAGILLL